MKVICVAGQYSGVGKTRFAEVLLSHLDNFAALKITSSYPGACLRKISCGICNSLISPYRIIKDKKIILKKNSDTARLKKAGAKQVVWLMAKPVFLKKGIRASIKKFKKCPGLIVEGNSFLKTNKADLSFLVTDRTNRKMKPSAKEILNKIDAIITGESYA